MTPHSSKARDALEAAARQVAEVHDTLGYESDGEFGRMDEAVSNLIDALPAHDILAGAIKEDRDSMLAAFERLVPLSVREMDGTVEGMESWLSAAVERAERLEAERDDLCFCEHHDYETLTNDDGHITPDVHPSVACVVCTTASLRSALAEAEHRWMDAAFGAGEWSFADLKASKEAGEPTRWKDS